MSPRERAKLVYDKIPGAVAAEFSVGLIEEAIIAAVAEERESCALQVDWLASGASGDAKAKLEHIAAMIRAVRDRK